MINVACMGILVADVITKTVDRLPERGKLERMQSIQLRNGGGAMSCSISLRRLGATSAIIGRVGADGFGEYLKSVLDREGVCTEGLVMDPEADTSASAVLVDSSGERSFLHCIGANARLCEEDATDELLKKCDVLFLTGTYLMDGLDGEPTAKLLKRAKELGKITVLDTAWDAKNRWMPLIRPALPYVDYFIPSIEEAEMIAGESDLDKMADCFFDCGVKHVAIKCGSKGSYLRETKESESKMIPAFLVKATDTTGAGDSFCSGFLYGLVNGFSMEDCCRTGNAVGAFCVQAVGATEGIRSYQEVKKFMDEYRWEK